MPENLEVKYATKTIQELQFLYENGCLNLEPGFQRKSVWTQSDRSKLIQSILDGYPVPSIFLYQREENGRAVYDVLDGKQRLETIFMYLKLSPFKRQSFDIKYQFHDDEKPYRYDWNDLKYWDLTFPFSKYEIQVAQVSGDLSDIIEEISE